MAAVGAKPFSYLRKPKVLGYFSLDGRNNIKLDDSAKRYINLAKWQEKFDRQLDRPIDLTYQEHLFCPLLEDEGAEKPNHMIYWIIDNKDHVYSDVDNRLKYDFVLSGGTLRRILRHPYTEKVIRREFSVYRLKQTFYIFANRGSAYNDLIYSYYGHKFEKEMTSATYDDQPDESDIVYEAKRFSYVLENEICDHKIMYFFKVDCVSQERDDQTGRILREQPIELTCMKGSVAPHLSSRAKMVDTWCKNFLADYTHSIFGIRNDKGMVNKLTMVKTSLLPRHINKIKSLEWDPKVCVNFADELFKFLKSSDMVDRKLYDIEVDSKGQINIMDALKPDSYIFPEWYTEQM